VRSKLEQCILIYVCTNQTSVDWLTEALNGFQLRLKATDAKCLQQPVKMTLRTLDKLSTGSWELLQWIKNINAGTHTESCKVLDRKYVARERRLILLVGWDLANATKMISLKTYTGLMTAPPRYSVILR
jgi:hypothetical protein